ncbi:hypothetical protein DFQ27_006201 [Actinomortierella ambigua]|uniref:Protein kinase domain-containing protein n=1 Tax=Actinomortierella ambigua TaxID=1343610 RepID=A0A9P6U1F3_9FUNG|nr:hypothetical protein DFQ27_006201 [Actinomortierella ambigua]
METNPSSALGSGTFGVVHKALYGDQPCAAKTFFVTQSELDRKTINKEISVLQRLRFRHVIQFYRTHEQNDQIYILMELAEKGSLAHAITKGHLACDDWVTKTRLAHEIARGLAYIHQEGVLHRDLKSANVLLTKHMEVKLADFGLAQIRSMTSTASSVSGQASKGAAGTLRWLAPELLYAAKPMYSTKSDVYALGVVMWEMAADCTRPFRDQHDDALVALSVKGGNREQLPGDTPTEYRQWVERCWAQNPRDRPSAGNVILVHDESPEESIDTDGYLLDLGSIGTGLTHASNAHNRDDGGFEQDAIPDNHDDYADSLPQTDDDVVTYFCTLAKAENTDAQLFLGWIYGHGRGVRKSERDSFWWYRKAANGGNVVAQVRLARMYQHGQGIVSSNASKAATWYRRAADGGSAEAQLALGKMYTDGYGVEEDTSQAARWYEMAAKQGRHEAQTILGQWFALGRGVMFQSDEQAVKWLTMAAEQGNPTAQRELGRMYMYGRGPQHSDADPTKWSTELSITRDEQDEEANQRMDKAAEQEDAIARYHFGLMYLYGRGVEQSDVEAVKWYTKAAEQGDVIAQKNLGMMYRCGRGVEQSDVEAVRWYTKAAEQGDANAQSNLGWMYEQGQGVEQSDVEAVKWYTKAAGQGYDIAQLRLGWMYKHGRGVDQSDIEAVKWYTKAAEQGNAAAQNNLGLMYQLGRGVDQSDVEAVKLYTKAVKQGDAKAQNNLGLMYEHGRGVDQSDVEAVKWCTKAAGQGIAAAQTNLRRRSAAQYEEFAQFNIASMYELGLAMDLCYDGPMRLYQETAAMGEPNTYFHVQWLTIFTYLDGQATPNAQHMFTLYNRGADQGYAAAQQALERMYERRLGAAQDAIVWYSKAAARGHTDAKQRMVFLQDHWIDARVHAVGTQQVSDPSDRSAGFLKLGELNSRLQGPVCCEFLRGAVMLNCHHNFCSTCLRRRPTRNPHALYKFNGTPWSLERLLLLLQLLQIEDYILVFKLLLQERPPVQQHHPFKERAQHGNKLGSGTFGVVHQALYGDQPCAAKAFFVSQSELDRKTINKEISVLQRLRFRHVIQFYRTHEHKDRIYILMELAEKGSLAHAITKGHLTCDDWGTKSRLAHEIALGLAYIHQEGVLHRDLKSANVLLTKHMEVKLADFGLAQIRSMASAASSASSQTSKGAAGTLRWLAPELLYAVKPIYSTKSDVYALGVVMWEMAGACTRPFKDQHDDALVALSVKNGHREQLPGSTPTEYRQWVERCWAQDPCDRPNAGSVILVHDESTEESTYTGGSFLDLSSSGTGLAHAPKTHILSDEGFEQDGIHGSHEDYVGSLPQTDDDVMTYFCTAAKAQNTDAQLFLGWIYCHGRGVGKSEQDSFWWYRTAANGGSVIAQILLARMYQHGQGIVSSNAFKAASWYRRAADGGSAEAQLALGKMYTDGYGVKEDTSQAARWYEMAAKQGHNEAQTILGQWFALGRGVIQSDEQAVKWLTLAAEQGNTAAQTRLGQMYLDQYVYRRFLSSENTWRTKLTVLVWEAVEGKFSGTLYKQGDQTNQNVGMAVKWLTKAAEQGDANAQSKLGWMYEYGQGMEHSDVEAVKWYTKAAEQGNAIAQESLGLLYLQGRGVKQSDIEAAAEQGNAAAQSNLGMMYQYGQGIDQSDVEAVNWYMKAAEQGNAIAQNNLGSMYQYGRGVEQSDVEAVKWYTKAAEQGNAAAQSNLGMMYQYGQGIDQSDVEAVNWYMKAAEQGNAIAQNNLGSMYQYGRGVEQSDVEAVKWYTKAAEKGNAAAQSNLGSMYQYGQGVDQSDVEAVNWYMKAAEQGNAIAQGNLGMMYPQGRGVDQSDIEAFKWYIKAAGQGDDNAQNNLGWCYDLGRGVEQCDVDAAKWYSRSAAQHNEFAQFNIASMYELGLAVDPLGEGPLHLYQEAAAKGEPSARFHVQWLTSPIYLDGQATTDAQHIFTLYNRGAEQGYTAAQQALGRMYERGLGVAQDAREAIVWYSKAAARGHTDAKQRMEFLQGHLD